MRTCPVAMCGELLAHLTRHLDLLSVASYLLRMVEYGSGSPR